MKYGLVLNKTIGEKAGQLSDGLAIREAGKKDRGFEYLKKGQLITGIVVSVDNGITIDFQGQKVKAPKSVIHNAIPGEKKTFEVVKVTDKEIELKLVDEEDEEEGTHNIFTATAVKDTDWSMVMSQKNRKARIDDKETKYRSMSEKLEAIAKQFTGKDCRLLEEEGFPAEGFTIDGLYEAMNRIKDKAFDEPVQTKDVPEKRALAYRFSEAAGKLDDKAMQYLISRNVSPTAGNIYKAIYSGTVLSQPLSEEEWEQLKEQAVSVISGAGYEVNEENLDTARWLLESGLPLTEETFSYKKELDELKNGYDQDKILRNIMQGMERGIRPEDVSLIMGSETSPKQIIEEINSIQPAAVTKAVQDGTRLTIRNLSRIQEELNSAPTGKAADAGRASAHSQEKTDEEADEELALIRKMSQETDSAEWKERYREVRAQRQMEEIRLKMTYEAAADLSKKGFRIETEELSRVVDALRELEDSYYRKLLVEADTTVTQESLNILKETTQSVGQLKYLPNFVLAKTLQDSAVQTIPGLLSEGQKLKAELEKAGQAYETLMTVPNREYGDSIQKAFAEMDSLLSNLHIESTEMNKRAVRALSYNRMEINEENISRIKAYDCQVTSLIRNLHPAVTVRMIKEGLNPLNMPITELNKTIDRIREEQGITSEERFSTFLHKLEKDNAISEQERKSYIGIYRLLYNVDKSDGAALGAVIKAGREVTLSNLLTAVQTAKKGRLDAVINDEFGELQSLTRSKESIAEQLSYLGADAEQFNQDKNKNEDSLAQQTQYLSRMIKQMKEDISPESLQRAANSMAEDPAFHSLTAASQGIWETVKDTPVEKLYEKLQAAASEKAADNENYQEKVKEIRELCSNAEQTIRFLNDYQMPGTPMNLLIASHILSNGESPIKRLLKQQKENAVEKSENSIKNLDELSDKLIDRQSMQETYEALEDEAQSMLSQACSQEKIDSFRLAQLKSICQQMTFVRKLAEKEFYQIPVETDNGITNINLTIIRGSEETGRLSVTVRSEALGNVKAEFTLKDKVLKGFIASDSRAGLEQLRGATKEIEEAAQESSVHLKQMDYGILTKDNDTYHYQNPEDASGRNPETERILYRLAKAIVRTIRTAENSMAEEAKAVS